jgi:hypothetical protein
MLFEFLTGINWVEWTERIICATAIFLAFLIIIWVIPIFVDWLLRLAGIHAKIRQGIRVVLSIMFGTACVFLVADVLGFNSGTVFSVLATVLGVGISWAAKDAIQNTISGLQVFMYQTFSIAIDYLLISGKISVDAEGKIGWIFYPEEAEKRLKKAHLFWKKPNDKKTNNDKQILMIKENNNNDKQKIIMIKKNNNDKNK